MVVCNNTSTSKLVYDYVSDFHRENEDGTTMLVNGRLGRSILALARIPQQYPSIRQKRVLV